MTTDTSLARKSFAVPKTVALSSGKSISIPKWGVLKLIKLGDSITSISQELIDVVRSRQVEEFAEAARGAAAKGLTPGDDAFPKESDFFVEDIKDFIAAIPMVLHKTAHAMGAVMEEALTLSDGTCQLTSDQALELDVEDFLELVACILEVNWGPLGKKLKRIKEVLVRA